MTLRNVLSDQLLRLCTSHRSLPAHRVAPAAFVLFAILGSAFVRPLRAQSPLGGPRLEQAVMPAPPFEPLRAIADAPRGKYPHSPSYWVEGGVFGGLLLGTTSAAIVHGLCDTGDCMGDTIKAGLLMTTIGFGAGALVDGAIPAKHPHPLEGHPLKGLLVGTAAGALTTFGIFSQGCLAGCSSREVNADLFFTGPPIRALRTAASYDETHTCGSPSRAKYVQIVPLRSATIDCGHRV